MTRDELVAVARRWVDAVNAADLDALGALLHPDFVQRTAGLPPGPNAVFWTERLARAAFPDLTVEIAWIMVDDDRVAYRAVSRGTHRGTFLGHAPTGKVFSVTGIDVLRVADGRVIERWTEFDTFGMLQQIGVVPRPSRREAR